MQIRKKMYESPQPKVAPAISSPHHLPPRLQQHCAVPSARPAATGRPTRSCAAPAADFQNSPGSASKEK